MGHARFDRGQGRRRGAWPVCSGWRRGLAAGLCLLAGCVAPGTEGMGEEVGVTSEALVSVAPSPGTRRFTHFESGPVRPMALSADGNWLYAVNIPDGSLEVFQVAANGSLTAKWTVPVGLEPVSVALRSSKEAWVVNHLSDSVSVVDITNVATTRPRVKRTLLVGDEPRDVVFAGTKDPTNGWTRAFVTTAHRGQYRAQLPATVFYNQGQTGAWSQGTADPRLTTWSIGRADVWVYDTTNLDTGGTVRYGGTPLRVLEFFGDTPRALASNGVSGAGSRVYAAVMNSGNRSTVGRAGHTCLENPNAPCTIGPYTRNGQTIMAYNVPGGDVGPASAAGHPRPEVGLMLHWDVADGRWEDRHHRPWGDGGGTNTASSVRSTNPNNVVNYRLPDQDVFAIDAASATPVETTEDAAPFEGVGTTLFNMIVNPARTRLYVANQEANNAFGRFEGPGTATGGDTLQGNLAQARITVIDLDSGAVLPRHLNSHIDYAVRPAPTSTRDASLSLPLEMAITSNGATLYVAAMGSNEIGVIDAAALESGTFDPATASASYIPVPGTPGVADGRSGPAGIVLSESRSKLFVYTRYDNGIAVIDTGSQAQVQHVRMMSPEPREITDGRPFLYDATLTSSNGEASCASCHIFGDKDDLSWDLGNPDGEMTHTNVAMHFELASTELGQILAGDLLEAVNVRGTLVNGSGDARELSPLKGPLSTQTLRGMQNHGATHWRGDRTNGFFGEDPLASTGPRFDARHTFKNFIVAFNGLVGRGTMLTDAQMESFANFAMATIMPPNPIRNLDNSLTPRQEHGRQFYFGCEGIDTMGLLIGALPFEASCTESYDGPGGVLDPTTNVGHAVAGTSTFNFLLQQAESCQSCHRLDGREGYFGTDGRMSNELLSQAMKVPQLRNLYTKVGMFGSPELLLEARTEQNPALGATGHGYPMGNQIRGFGFMTHGGQPTLFNFFNGFLFDEKEPTLLNGDNEGRIGFTGWEGVSADQQRADIVEFLMAYPSDLQPIVGQQVTLRSSSGSDVALPFVNLLIQRANANYYSRELNGTGPIKECELVARANVGGASRGWIYRPSTSNFEPDNGTANVALGALQTIAGTAGQEVTFTCVPPGSGVRMGIDRDGDSYANLVDPLPNDPGNSLYCTAPNLDCDNNQPACTQVTSTNLQHYQAGRATRVWGIIFCGLFDYCYFAKGSGTDLGGSNTTKTLYQQAGNTGYFNTSPWCYNTSCETNSSTHVNHCGACGHACDFPHAAESCSDSTCVMGACEAGYTDCDADTTTGCEAYLATDPSNCGDCGEVCGAGRPCVGGVCSTSACLPNLGSCDGNAANGCETDLRIAIGHCGACNSPCAEGQFCEDGECVQP